MGNKGFVGPSSLVYHVHQPTQVLAVEPVKELSWVADWEATFRNRHFRTSRLAADAQRHGRPGPAALQRRRRPVVRRSPPEDDEFFYRNAQGDEVVYVSDGSGVLESPLGEPDVRAGRLSRRAARHRAPVPVHGAPGPAAGDRERRLRPHAPPLPQRVRAAHGERAVQRARHPAARRPADRRPEGRVPDRRQEGEPVDPRDGRSPSVRRRGLGRLLLPVGVQHQRLRAQGRPRAPAAAGPPDLRGRRVRGLLVLPEALRFRPEGGAGAVRPLAT